MRFKKDPRHKPLFDPYAPVFSKVGYHRIRASWREIFRETILALMPVDIVEKRFDPVFGRPTKELYSMAGLLFLKEMHDWTEEQAVDAYMFHADIQYALNLEPSQQSMSVRTLQRYTKIFRENDLAASVMHSVTVTLVELLEQNISRQRLDSTHFHSDMATFGRTRMMGVTIKRFLTQVRRHCPEEYEGLPEELRKRYEPSTQRMFADVDKAGRAALRQQVAEDLHWLIERFADDTQVNGRKTYRMLLEVFEDQCEIEDESIRVKKKTGGDVIQNPSDPDATYDGLKGPGYQVQLTETCSEDNEAQLIVSAIVQTAVESDQESVAPVLEDLKVKDLLPERLDTDGGYGSDENVELAREEGVDLQSPVAGNETKGDGDTAKKDPYNLSVDDFVIDPETETVQRCPAGHEPVSSIHDQETGTTTTIMPDEACAACEFGAECPIKRVGGQFRLKHTGKQRRLEGRRREQATEAFKEAHCKRGGIEGTNSAVKKVTGLARLRVRGLAAVRHAVYLRVAGWNILRAAAALQAKSKGDSQAEAETARENAASSTSPGCLGASSPSLTPIQKILAICAPNSMPLPCAA